MSASQFAMIKALQKAIEELKERVAAVESRTPQKTLTLPSKDTRQ